MKYILQCSICLQNLTAPVSLNCGHTFCSSCIQSAMVQQDYCACPLCRQPAFTYGNKIDELLSEVMQIYEKQGTETLLNEFPSLIICLSCGLTPVNPIILPCQHMFCMRCIQDNLQNELICPACSEICLTLNLNTNQKYKELISWYFREYKVQEEEQQQQIIQMNSYNGIPIFIFDQRIPIYGQGEFQFLEFRYQEMIKIACEGSGNFVISQDLKFGNLVKIQNVQKTQKGFKVKVISIVRVNINFIFTYSNGVKILYNQGDEQNLCLGNCQCIQDSPITKQINQQYTLIIQTLDTLYQNCKEEIQYLFKNIIMNLKKLDTSNSSLILLACLNYDFEKEYYEIEVSDRINLIQQFLSLLEQNIRGDCGTDNAKAKFLNIEIKKYPQMDITTQYFINIFNINTTLFF